jgi:hypothetical protein
VYLFKGTHSYVFRFLISHHKAVQDLLKGRNVQQCQYTQPLFYAFFLNAPYQFTPLLNLRFPIFGLMSFGWLHSITLTPRICWEYRFSLTPFFDVCTLFLGIQLGRKTSAGCNMTKDIYLRIVTSGIYKCREQ